MRFVLPTSGLDLACAVPNFTGIPAVTAQPASSVYRLRGSRHSPNRAPIQPPTRPAMGGADPQFPSLMLYNLAIPHGCLNAKVAYILSNILLN